ncbi:MAG: hypothetical protein H6512_08140 [Acidimicrobiia bacterium]|nr:hypothetical protein [Acidimicrobiia bacterium]
MPGLDWAGTRTAFDRVETRWPQIGRYRNRLDHRLQPLTVRWRHVRRLGPLPNWVPGVLVISLLVLLLAPPQTVFIPTGGLDPSYYAGLAMAKTRGLHFGSEVMFTYGPWGFLENTGVYETGPAWWATLYRVLVQGVAVFALVAVLRHNFGRLATLAIGFVSARWGFELMYGVGPSRLLTVTVIGVLVFVLTRRVTPGRGWALAASVLGSFLVLVKFNDGVVVLTAAALAAVVSGWRRSRFGVAPRPASPSEADSLLLPGRLGHRFVKLWRLCQLGKGRGVRVARGRVAGLYRCWRSGCLQVNGLATYRVSSEVRSNCRAAFRPLCRPPARERWVTSAWRC